MSAIIEVDQLGKMYRIGRSESVVRYRSLRDNVTRAVRHPVRFAKRHILRDEEFWALKEVSFAVEPASTLAIVGPNGSGKSTLLKILSRIVEPTEGQVRLRGRVASLLEVGTGFHPELTGRDNIYLNGALLGMSRREIRSKFDQIVEFAGVERFLDTPVKHYSSGMYVRLAFSVAAHLEPEILIVDEVLAVGDAEFQKRSLGKMEEVTRTSGRTVLFVSHNMAAVESLCTSGILLTQGRVQAAGDIHDVVAAYAQHVRPVTSVDLEARRDRRGSGRAVFTSCSVLGDAPDDARTIRLKFAYRNEADEPIRDVKVSVLLRDALGTNLVNLTNQVLDQRIDLAATAGTILLDVYGVNLESGVYSLDVFLATDSANSEILDWVENAIAIEVDNDRFYPTHRMPPTRGIALLDFRYSAE